ncbi:M48 family metalloprotease [Opitutus terrae]|uniref:Peptidase M48 Ste24p n=1 Tax=Opitutus terrae (strain DSM 11246 / JCM 15787 / PB90-1) TaxID=452637 RepID=B1ZPD1_OPITP|nr:M48 family metalloprotease [Opitutus terrae]ACB73536.1 peptidase M48 Ste24p [Opitutus terrae PB90-1]
MDFFEAQARAKKRTSRLVVLFILAVLGTILASYIAAVIGLRSAMEQREHRYDRDGYLETVSSMPWWQPKLFFGVSSGVLAIVGIASLAKWSEFSAGGSAVAESVGGRRIAPQTTDLRERRLLNVVEEMAIASGLPVPAVYVLEDEPGINAFAAGLTTNDAVVAVTRGTLDKLNRDELQGVVGHEFSHILNGDMRLNLRLTALLFGILVLGLAGRGILWSMRYAAAGRSRRDKNAGGIVVVILFVGLALLIIGYVGYFFGRLIQAAVSRQREFLADASAVQFTRNPGGLTGALKKIGGYALGSKLQTSKAAAIGHFFFAQSFRSGFTGLWSTHPPLAERIKAIEPQFDGTMFTPPEKVDVEQESFVSAGLHPAKPQPSPAKLEAFSAAAAIATIGALSAEQVSNAGTLLTAVPPRLREATRSVAEAPILLCGVLLDSDPAVRQQQRALVAQHAGPDALAALDQLTPDLRALGAEHKLPLVQLTLPTLRQLPPAELSAFLGTLDELVHADERVSPFEFALQKLLTRGLSLERSPKSAVVQFYSFRALSAEIATVLSALAHCATENPDEARDAFATGAGQLKLLEGPLSFVATSPDYAALDAALEKLAAASLPIKQRTLLACAHVVSANGSVSVAEAELLRAFAATLDCPMPPLAAPR